MWWTSNASSVLHSFQNKVMLLLKIMLIYDEPLLNRQPPLSRHSPVPQGLPALNGGATTNIKLCKLSYLSFSCVLLCQSFTGCFLYRKGQEEGNLQHALEEIHGKITYHWQGSVGILQGAEKDIEGVNCHSNKELLDTKASLSAQSFERKEQKNTSYSNLIPV